jgi:glycosyltransferase involved in cell wall biosynthesis
MRIIHVIIGLNTGGAELMLKRIVLNSSHAQHEVVSLTSLGVVGKSLESQDIKVHAMGLTIYNFFNIFLRLVYYLHKTKPDTVQTWMYHSDLFGGTAARLSGVRRVIWNIRNTEIPQKAFSTTGLIIRLCALFSHFVPDKIICCANTAMTRHVQLGYSREKIVVIPNGFSVNISRPDTIPDEASRKLLQIHDDNIVIGMIGRYDYLKGYDILARAASQLLRDSRKNIIFLCAGRNVEWSNLALTSIIYRLNLQKNFRLVGEVRDVQAYLSLMNIFCLSSRSEGFPNVVGEAMLASLPCVVTDVGDAATIVGNEGLVVPPNNHLALAEALRYFINLDATERVSIGSRGRARIIERYDIKAIARIYDNIYAGNTLLSGLDSFSCKARLKD